MYVHLRMSCMYHEYEQSKRQGVLVPGTQPNQKSKQTHGQMDQQDYTPIIQTTQRSMFY